MPYMYSSRCQKHLYDESALSRFEVLTKPLYKCNEVRPYYATQYQDIFIQYQEGYNFVPEKPSPESQLYRKSEKYELIRKQNWFGAVHPNIQIDAELDYMISRVLLEMDHTSLNIYKKKLCDLDRDLQQTAFILRTRKFPLVGYIITGKRHTFATFKCQNVV